MSSRNWIVLGLIFLRPAPEDAVLRELVELSQEEGPLTGVVYLARREGRPIVRALGRDPEEAVPIGSGRKLLTAVVVLALVDDGRLALDAPISTWLPAWDRPGHDRITLRRLLSHTSGLPPRPTGGRCSDAPDLATCVDRLADEPLRDAPGERFHYSSSGYVVAARIAEIAGGRPFAELLRDRVLAPIGAHHTTFRHDGPAGLEGTVWSTPSDFGAFLRMLLRDGELDGVRVLSEASVAELERGQTGGVPKRGLLPRQEWPAGYDYYGLGLWRTATDEDGRLRIGHTYGKPGFLAWVNRRAGVVGVLAVSKTGRDGDRDTFDDLIRRFSRAAR